MNSEKEQALRHTLQAIQKRLGSDAIAVGSSPTQAGYIATGFPDLDAALGGGLPRGRLTEIVGQPTSGATSLALKTMAQAQKAGDVVVYLDLSSTFDPDSASRCEVKVADMLIARPATPVEALDILFDAVASGLPGMLVLNVSLRFTPADRSHLAAVLRRLHPTLTRSRCALLLLSQPHLMLTDLTNIAAIRLLVERDEWVYEGREVAGYQARVSLLKHKSSARQEPAKTITITIQHSGQGDGI